MLPRYLYPFKKSSLNLIRKRIERENGAKTRTEERRAEYWSRETILELQRLLKADLQEDLRTKEGRISALKALRKILQSIPER